MTSLREIFALACPKCGQDDALDIQIACMSQITADGSEPYGDHDWDGASYCSCPECGYSSDVADFTLDGGRS
ncbi:MAG: hypothetical protein ABL982_26350 [Vicinamibacterales bacterium]